jgi:hypothetical protein
LNNPISAGELLRAIGALNAMAGEFRSST